jgi:DNA-binding transcriptional LysR family regulator
MVHVHRVLADVEELRRSSNCAGLGHVGNIRLGVRMPPVGEPLRSLLCASHAQYPDVALTLHEMNERDTLAALEERRLDIAFVTKHALWSHAVAEPIYRERILAALAKGHRLSVRKSLNWSHLLDETFLVQGWEESQTAREFYASFLGSGAKFHAHAASKQSVMALVGAGFGRPISEADAWVGVELVWVRQNKDAAVGRFVAFMRDEAQSRHLV